jgi:hypothetical protein
VDEWRQQGIPIYSWRQWNVCDYARKSGCSVVAKTRCHIRLFTSTLILPREDNSCIGIMEYWVLITPIVKPLRSIWSAITKNNSCDKQKERESHPRPAMALCTADWANKPHIKQSLAFAGILRII